MKFIIAQTFKDGREMFFHKAKRNTSTDNVAVHWHSNEKEAYLFDRKKDAEMVRDLVFDPSEKAQYEVFPATAWLRTKLEVFIP